MKKRMTPVEIFALIIALVAAIKIIVILIKPTSWMVVVKKVYANTNLTMVVSLVLAVIVLWYLLAELTIVQIFAAMLFLALLSVSGVAVYGNDMISLAQKMLKNKAFLRKAWLPILIWIVLIIWVLYSLFI